MKTLLKSPFNISLKVNNHSEIQNKEGFPSPLKQSSVLLRSCTELRNSGLEWALQLYSETI